MAEVQSYGAAVLYTEAPYATETILAGRAPEDSRRVTVGRIFYVDLPKAVKRYARGYTKDQRETLRTDALMWIVSQGSGSAPLRRDWIEPESQPVALTQGAWNMMRRALRAAEGSREMRADVAAQDWEVPSSGESWGALAEKEDRTEEEEEAHLAAVPDASAERVARFMGIPLDAGRALIYSAYNLSPDTASEEWGIARASVPARVSAGAAKVRKLYPDTRDLLAALRDAGAALRESARDDCESALLDYASGYATAQQVERAAREYLSTIHSAPYTVRALEVAARIAVKRAWILIHGDYAPHDYAMELAARIASSSLRLVPAEADRARKSRLATAPIHRGLASPVPRARMDIPNWLRLQRAPIVECSARDWEGREIVPRAEPVPRLDRARYDSPEPEPLKCSAPVRTVWWTDADGARHTAPARSVAPLPERAARMHVDAWLKVYGADGREPEPFASGDYTGAYMEGEK